MTKWKWTFACAFTLSLVVFFAPIPSGPPGEWGLDKIAHGLIFTMLLASGFWAYPKARWKIFWLLVAYAPTVELLQHYVFTYRSFDWRDIAAGWLGIAIFSLINRFTKS